MTAAPVPARFHRHVFPRPAALRRCLLPLALAAATLLTGCSDGDAAAGGAPGSGASGSTAAAAGGEPSGTGGTPGAAPGDDAGPTTRASTTTRGRRSTGAGASSAAPDVREEIAELVEAARAQSIVLEVRGGAVSPASVRVRTDPGETVRAVVVVDRAGRVVNRALGVDVAIKAGRPTAVDLTAEKPGVNTVQFVAGDRRVVLVTLLTR